MCLNNHFSRVVYGKNYLQVGYEGNESIEKTDDIICYFGIGTGDSD